MYQKILEIFKNIIVISKFTKTLKKRSVFLLGLIGNLLVLSDILIILIFLIFDQNIDTNNIFISYFIDYKEALPLLVLFRFLLIYLERVAVTKLQFRIEENLRVPFRRSV